MDEVPLRPWVDEPLKTWRLVRNLGAIGYTCTVAIGKGILELGIRKRG